MLALAVLCSGAFLGAIDPQLVNVAFPDMLRDFPGSELAELSWVFNGYTIIFTAALLPAGGLADRFGAGRVYLAGLATFTASAAVCAVAPNVGVLIAARLVQGAAGGIITPLTLALILPHYPRRRHATAIGTWSAAQSLAMASGPALGGLLVAVWDWRTVFVLHLPVGVAVLSGAWWTVGTSEHAAGGGSADTADAGDTGDTAAAGRGDGAGRLPDFAGLLLLVAAIGLPSLAIVRSESWGPASPRTAAALLAGIAAGIVFVRRTRRHPAPIIELGVLTARSTRWANTAMFLVGLVMFALTLANVLFLTQVWGYSEARAGLAITPGPIAYALAAALAGRLVGRYGHPAGVLTGAAFLALATLVLALGAGAEPAYGMVVLPAVVASGAGVAILVTSLSGAAVADIPPARMATGTALSVTSRACGAVIGLSTLALVLSSMPSGAAGTYRGIWLVMAALCVVIAAASPGLRSRERRGA